MALRSFGYFGFYSLCFIFFLGLCICTSSAHFIFALVNVINAFTLLSLLCAFSLPFSIYFARWLRSCRCVALSFVSFCFFRSAALDFNLSGGRQGGGGWCVCVCVCACALQQIEACTLLHFLAFCICLWLDFAFAIALPVRLPACLHFLTGWSRTHRR